MRVATINVAIEIEGDDTACDKVFETVNGMPEIFQAVVAERSRQDQQWGGPEHDDSHPPFTWWQLLTDHACRLLLSPPGDDDTATWNEAAEADPDYRQHLIKIAALAVAAVQAWDRSRAISAEES